MNVTPELLAELPDDPRIQQIALTAIENGFTSKAIEVALRAHPDGLPVREDLVRQIESVVAQAHEIDTRPQTLQEDNFESDLGIDPPEGWAESSPMIPDAIKDWLAGRSIGRPPTADEILEMNIEAATGRTRKILSKDNFANVIQGRFDTGRPTWLDIRDEEALEEERSQQLSTDEDTNYKHCPDCGQTLLYNGSTLQGPPHPEILEIQNADVIPPEPGDSNHVFFRMLCEKCKKTLYVPSRAKQTTAGIEDKKDARVDQILDLITKLESVVDAMGKQFDEEMASVATKLVKQIHKDLSTPKIDESIDEGPKADDPIDESIPQPPLEGEQAEKSIDQSGDGLFNREDLLQREGDLEATCISLGNRPPHPLGEKMLKLTADTTQSDKVRRAAQWALKQYQEVQTPDVSTTIARVSRKLDLLGMTKLADLMDELLFEPESTLDSSKFAQMIGPNRGPTKLKPKIDGPQLTATELYRAISGPEDGSHLKILLGNLVEAGASPEQATAILRQRMRSVASDVGEQAVLKVDRMFGGGTI
jgi:hypothetical protein